MLTPVVNNKRKLRVFDVNETDFSHNGHGVIHDAIEPRITINMDGLRTLNFQLDFKSPSWQLIKHGLIVRAEGQNYRITQINRRNSGDEVSEVTCFHVFADSAFIPLNEFPKGVPDKEDTVRNHLLSAFEGSRFHIMTHQEVASLGMEWADDLVFIDGQNKVSAGDILSQCITQLEKGELYIDNWSIAVVKRLGRNKGVKISETANSEAINEESDYADVINVITVTGKDDLALPDTFPDSIIRSEESIRLYGERGGYLEFDQVEDQVELLAKAQYEISPTNPDRIDMPKASLKITYIDLAKMYAEYPTLGVGDSVIVPRSLSVDEFGEARITQIIYYPLSPENSEITIGNPPRSLTDYISAAIQAGKDFKKVTDERGRIKTSWLDSIKQTYRTYLNAQLGMMQVNEHLTGDVWVHPDGDKALAIIGGMMAIANSKTPEGDWAWNTFMTAEDVTSDTGNFGQLNTGVLKIVDDEGYLNIFSSLIEMYSENPDDPDNPIRRMLQGVDPYDNIFKYVLYNEFGEPVIYFDADGQLQVKGRVETETALTTNLYAEYGDVSDLTVNRLQTSEFVNRFNLRNNLPVRYLKAEDQWIEYIEAEVLGVTSTEGSGLNEQLVNRNGHPVFWQEDPNGEGNYIDEFGILRRENGQRILTTTAETDWEVRIYKYNHIVKMRMGFSLGGSPTITFGAGTGNGDNGKGAITKTDSGIELSYKTADGEDFALRLGEDGISIINGEHLIEQFRTADHVPMKVEVVKADPVNTEIGRMWLVDDFA